MQPRITGHHSLQPTRRFIEKDRKTNLRQILPLPRFKTLHELVLGRSADGFNNVRI